MNEPTIPPPSEADNSIDLRQEYIEWEEARGSSANMSLLYRFAMSISRRCNAAESALEAVTKQRDELLAAIRKFSRLPNWQNRCGPWKSENEAIENIVAVAASIEHEKGN